MGLAYNRIERDGKTKIVYVRAPYFTWGTMLLFILGFLSAFIAAFGFANLSGYFFFLALILAATYGLSSVKVSFEINRKVKMGGVKITGSMFSFKNPTTYEFKE